MDGKTSFQQESIYPDRSSSQHPLEHTKPRRRKTLLKATFVFLAVVVTASLWQHSRGSWSNDTSPGLGVSKQVQQEWAAYSPYFPEGKYEPPPSHCVIDQVNILQRHGARYPTAGAIFQILAALEKIQSVKEYTDPRLDFLKSYKYDLGSESLVKFGAIQSSEAGAEAYDRYSGLVSKSNLPFVRSSNQMRVVDSAKNWISGFASASKGAYNPPLAVVLNETELDTLSVHKCPARIPSWTQPLKWLPNSQFGPQVTNYLNQVAKGANLSYTNTWNLMSLCPFETVAHQSRSPFCDIFDRDEDPLALAFPGFEYVADLEKYYGTGYGQELGPIEGVGYITELLTRLTGEKTLLSQDQTKVNQDLDSNPATFPLDRAVYADFSHDNLLVAVYAAMGLVRQPAPLSITQPNPPPRTWVTSHLVPFSGRLVVERLQCGSVPSVRVFINDQIQPLPFCNADEDNVCTVSDFLASQEPYSFHQGQNDWKKCEKST